MKENYSVISAEDYERFLKKWSEYDPTATGWIDLENLIYLLFEIPYPLGLYKEGEKVTLWEKFLCKYHLYYFF
jgi:hypothetical protein